MDDSIIREMPEGFGGLLTKDITNMHPLGLTVMLILGILMILVPRRWAILPIIIMACFISSNQKIVVLGLDFNLLRIMVLFGVVRILIKKEYMNYNWKTIDKVMIYYVISASLIFILQQKTLGTLIFRMGQSFDVLGMYFLARYLILNWHDIDKLILGSVIISFFVAIVFAVESKTQRNMFSIFGGVPEFTVIRKGELRCQGAFAHPILAGCFFAVLLPFFAAMWWRKGGGKIWALIGVMAATFIIITCHSSTPLFGMLCAILGGIMFLFRYKMSLVRWGIVCALITLDLIMKAPVWFLIARVSEVVGGTGYHRAAIIDAFIRRFSEWFLLGTASTAHWYWGAQDITNQYILEAVRGGALTLTLFIVIIVLGFQGIGRLWRSNSRNPYLLALSWALGVGLFVHCVNFVGVSYFGGQINALWYLTLGIIGSMCPENKNKKK